MAKPKSSSSIRRLRLSGAVFLLTTSLVLLAAWNTGTNLFYLVVGGLASFLIVSVLTVGWGVRGLRVFREAPEAVHRCEPVAVRVRIENHKRLLPSLSLRVEGAARRGEAAGYIAKIPPRRAAVVQTTVVFDRRGVYPLPPVEAVSLFPFGLLEKRRRFPAEGEIVVYPRVQSMRAAVADRLPGARAAPRAAAQDGDEFFSLREYVRGDDLRRIAWRASARLGTLLVKELSQEASRFVVFVLDTYRPDDLADFDARFEEAVELVASLAVTLLHQQFAVALATPRVRVPEGKGKAQVTKVLDCLARVEPGVADRHGPATEAFVTARAFDARLAFVSPDPRQWGQPAPFGRVRYLDPREVVRA